ncbi:MAG: IS3 family transposase [Candidatus Wallbacteria bacterium HGW-Wallbacteria-1]|uniref:IS3 family transposase n=1 Tax=Candidatus Wallbacteria bacterium HGW-Wallbacteria-1 TaxID=2013854 RepID=A0A2N1PJU9_9BACT|nr:MAG: IS3 family transposase [Candidatus Wallbacteria bacterium HGW-Wallbacteria-1]
MSQMVSEETGRRYGIERVCRVWEKARSTFYNRCNSEKSETPSGMRRGPKPLICDEIVFAMVQAYLEATPFAGEGHRKVWAYLKFVEGIKVGRGRVLRLMRENNLLSPHRSRAGQPKQHDGKIVTMAPNLLWGTDGARVFTVDQGWCWIFSAVEHWNAECVGWHVCKYGTRFQALEPITMALNYIYGSSKSDIARGLSLRMDHGSQYRSEHFLKQLKFWGIKPSFAFVSEPQTNGVAERFNRTLKEQIIYGRVYRNIDDLRDAVRTFVATYNSRWRVAKNRFRTPEELRKEWDGSGIAA